MVSKMNYADFKKLDTLNGEGIRHSLFVSGCSHRCKGCFNAVTWNKDFGKPFTEETTEMIIQAFKDSPVELTGLSLLGGEPFENAEGLSDLVDLFAYTFPDKDVWCWTGYTFEQLCEKAMSDEHVCRLLMKIDVLIDGKFELPLKDLKLKFRGSSNQRIIDVQKSLWDWDMQTTPQAVELTKYY